MNEICTFPINRRWPARFPDRLQLYSSATPTGIAVSIMLEETGLPYELHAIDPSVKDDRTPEFLSLDPDGRGLAIIDPDGPDDAPLLLFDSGAILLYLAEKTSQLMPASMSACYQIIQWVSFRMSTTAPRLEPCDSSGHDAPIHRRCDESRGLLNAVESRLAGRDWIMDEGYSIADISMLGWVRHVTGDCNPEELVRLDHLQHTPAWMERCLKRPAVQRGLRAFAPARHDDPTFKRPASGMPAF